MARPDNLDGELESEEQPRPASRTRLRHEAREVSPVAGDLAPVPCAWELQFHVLYRAASRFWPRCIGQWSLDKPVISAVEQDDGSRIQYRFRIAAV